MKKLLYLLSALLPTILMMAGACAISWACGLVYRPAGIAVGGGFLLAAGLLLIKGGGEKE